MRTTFSPLLEKLIESLRKLPGVGSKTAQRMAFHLLERDRKGALEIAHALNEAVEKIQRCQRCRILCELPVCSICTNERRDASLLCVLETPADVIAIEQTASFRGLYFVLGGHLSPIDGIGPEQIGIDLLAARFQEKSVEEVILATNPTVEGEATAHYIAELAKEYGIKSTRIAYGVPVGGELEYIDAGTLSRALENRGAF